MMPKVSIALMGNSVLYYNDVPRLLEAFGGSDLFDQGVVEQDSCLRGGVGFSQLLAKGNGMEDKFGAEDPGSPDVNSLLSRPWDYVVMNDYTQAPARAASRRASIDVLIDQIAPMLRRCGGTPILLETWAYRAPTKGSDDLGEHAEFTARLQEGYREYAAALAAALPPEMQPRVAPVGTAFLAVRELRKKLWRELFHTDGVHPSPLGSYLEGLVIYATVFGSLPSAAASVPDDPSYLWARARRMQPANAPPNRLPTVEEMNFLRGVAAKVCAVPDDSPKVRPVMQFTLTLTLILTLEP